jgi:tetratricopeptide (TPR) repeat protein
LPTRQKPFRRSTRPEGWLGRYQQLALALSDFDRAVETNPRDPAAFYNRAVALERKGDLDQAIHDLDESLRLRPDSTAAIYERGYAYLRKRDYDHAIGDLDQTIRLDPKFAKAYQQRSAAWKAKGDAAKADADAQRAAALDPRLTPPSLPPAPPAPIAAPASASHELSDADRQIAYCLEASFGYTQRYARLVARIRQGVQTVNALLDRPDVSPTDKDQARTQLKSMTDTIPVNEAAQKHWQANSSIFIEQLKRRGLLDKGKIPLIAAISQEVGRDQQTVTETYASCLRLCKPGDASCKAACDDHANKSDASRRMMACDQVAARLK